MKRGAVLQAGVVALAFAGAIAIPLAPVIFGAGASTTYVRRGGDTMNGALSMSRSYASVPYPIGMQSNVATAGGVCFSSHTANGSVCTGGNIVFSAPSGRFTVKASSSNAAPLDVVGDITSTSGSVQAALAVASSRNAAPAVIIAGTGWWEDDGDTAVNVESRVPTAGRGALKYDDTRSRWRAYEGTNWNAVIAANPDGGTPYGPLHYWTAYNGVTTASTRKLTAITARERTRVMGVSFVPTTVGVGAGTFNIEVRDITGAVSLCTSGNISCTSPVGTMSETACAAVDVTGGNQVAVQIICGGCGTCPLGNATAVMQQL